MRHLDGLVEVASLLLDPLNPRLPEGMSQSTQAEMLAYLYEHDVLDELADSYLTNGFFLNEQLLVLPEDDEGKRIVVEGNRRLAALKYVLHDADADSAGVPRHQVDPEPPPEKLESLKRVPVVQLDSRDELANYLGFRHINGPKTWSPEAKARYLYGEVEKAVREGSVDPFYEVGRRTGSNALGVRNAYHSYDVLRAARDELDLREPARQVLSQRFGVWTRLLGTANVPGYVGLGGIDRSYASVVASTDSIQRDRLDEVLTDLLPQNGRQAVLNDSRDVTNYSSILASPPALAVLRDFGRIDLAAEVANGSDFDNRLKRLLESLQSSSKEVLGGVALTSESPALARSILRESRNLSALVTANADEEQVDAR